MGDLAPSHPIGLICLEARGIPCCSTEDTNPAGVSHLGVREGQPIDAGSCLGFAEEIVQEFSRGFLLGFFCGDGKGKQTTSGSSPKL